MLVDTYGICRYKEHNPAIVSIVTFPFLFGMMFGDIGHGSILLAVGLGLTWKSDWLKANGYGAAAMVRYIILLMGISAVFCGLVYNEFFAMQLNLFTSCYKQDSNGIFIKERAEPSQSTGAVPEAQWQWVFKKKSPDCVYPIGFDPVWAQSSNMLSVANNNKMKMSVIFGILHMTIGILIKGTNTLHFKQWAMFVCEVVTGVVILLGLFGWMDLLIIAKWLYPNDISTNLRRSDYAWSLLNMKNTPIPADQRERFLEATRCHFTGAGVPIPNPWCDYQADFNNGRMTSVIQILIQTFIGMGPPTNGVNKSPNALKFDLAAAYVGGGNPNNSTRYMNYPPLAFVNLPVGCAATQPELCQAWEVPA